MEILTDLKAILHSKRANIYYLEKCRVMQKDGRVLYLSEEQANKQYWNIPIANTTCILLGTGTSITRAAVRMLASAGVLIGFSGTGGTPLIAANEQEFRQQCLQNFTRHKALDFMFEKVKAVALKTDWETHTT